MGGSSAQSLFARFLEREHSDLRADFEVWVRRHPEHEGELRTLLAKELERRSELDTAGAADASPGSSPGESRGDSVRRRMSQALDVLATVAVARRPGEVIGGFRLIERIGRGGQGEVWEAEELSLRRRVALKLVLPDRATTRSLALFAREARAGGRLAHPGIVSVHAHGVAGGVHWIAQELVPGSWTLRDFIDETRKEKREATTLPDGYFAHAAAFMARLADALQAAHDEGVIHRDVKPQNVLITPDDRPKLGDFGLARIEDETAISRTGSFAGTYAYMSPEQVAAGRSRIDHRTDVFSFGIVMYEMLALSRPFDGDTVHQVAEKILTWDPPDLRRVGLHVPRDLAVICSKTLEKRRSDRYRSMAEVAADLRRYLADEPIHARPDGLVRRTWKWVRRHPTPAAVSVLGLAALVLVGWLFAENRAVLRAKGRAERDTHYERARRWIVLSNLPRAEEEVARALELDPEDYRGDLIMAYGYRTALRVPEADARLERARAKGFHESLDGARTAEDWAYRGIAVLAQRDHTRYDEAEGFLARALELDPDAFDLNLLLYQLRSGRGDRAGASDAMQAYLARLGQGEDFYPIGRAILHELHGEYGAAIRSLESLPQREGIEPQRLVELRFHRHYGRILLGSDQPDRALEPLERAVEEVPNDGPSLLALAEAHRRLALSTYREQEPRGGEESYGHLLEAERWAERAMHWMQGAADYLLVRAHVALELLRREPVPASCSDERATDAAEQVLRRLEETQPDHPELRHLWGRLRFLQALCPHATGDRAAAIGLLGESLELEPANPAGWVLFAQQHWFEGRYAEALDALLRALEVWDAPGNEGRWSRRWLHGALIWAFGTATRLDDELVVEECKGRMLEELDAGATVLDEDLLFFAEFLGTAPEAYKDCLEAMRTISEHGLEDAFVGTEHETAAAGILASIRSACGG